MKNRKIISMMVVLTIIVSSLSNAIVYGEGSGGGSGGGSSSGGDSIGGDSSGSSSSGGDSTGGDSSGSSSTGNSTGGDSSGSSNTGNSSTGGDSSGSSNTGNSSTGGDNSGSENNGNQSSGGVGSGGGDVVQNMYGELTQLKAQISQNSQDIANQTMNKVMAAYGDATASGTTSQTRNQYQILLNKLNGLNLNTQAQLQLGDAINYLKSRIQFRIQLLDNQADYEETMDSNQLQLSNNVMTKLEARLKYRPQQYQSEQYQLLLGKIQQKKETLGSQNFDESKYKKIREMLEYMEIKAYGKIDRLTH